MHRSVDYSAARYQRPLFRYGLHRRTDAAERLISEIASPHDRLRVLDIGTADGAMLEILGRKYRYATFLGVEANRALCSVARARGLQVVNGDARLLPLASGGFDIVLMSATLKHVDGYQAALRECARVLVPGGHLIVLDPTVLGIWLGVRMGHFDRRYLRNVWGLGEACQHVASEGFRVVLSFKYVLSPIYVPGILLLEHLLAKVNITEVFLQQAILARRP